MHTLRKLAMDEIRNWCSISISLCPVISSGGNFPVDSLCGSFAEIFDGFRDIVADFNADDQQKLFHDNAMRIYAMDQA